MPVPPRVRLLVSELAPLHDTNGVAVVRLLQSDRHRNEFADFLRQFQRRRHGITLPRAGGTDAPGLVAAVYRDGRIQAVLSYQIEAYGGQFDGHHLLADRPRDRAALLRWIARHDGQAREAVLQLPPEQRAELWLADFAVRYETRATYPDAPTPIARLLRVDELTGIRAGLGGITVDVQDLLLPHNDGCYGLQAEDGHLTVALGGQPQAALDIAGLTALVYGVATPAELVGCGLLDADDAAQRRLADLFPPMTPYTYLQF